MLTEEEQLLKAEHRFPDRDVAATEEDVSWVSRAPNITPLTGYILIFLGAVLQAAESLLFRIAETTYEVNPSVALLIPSACFVLLCAITMMAFNLFDELRLPRLRALQLLARGFCTAMTLYLLNISFIYVPVGTGMTLLATTPAITSVLSALFLRDALTCTDVILLLVNMGGVALVSQPSAVRGNTNALLGAVSGLGAAVCASAGFCLVKAMGIRVHFVLNTLSIGTAGVILSAFVTKVSDVSAALQSPIVLLLLTSCGVVGFVSQCFFNWGVQVCRPGPALVVKSFIVPVSFVLGLVFLNETMSFMACAGVAFVLGSVMFIGINQYLRERRTESAAV